MCQDHPAKSPLNILDPDFEAKYRQADFSHRRACSGCTYSCYWITQKSFEPRNWPGVAGMWWKAGTDPDEPCRKTEREKGPFAGLLHYSTSRLLSSAQRLGKSALSLVLPVAITSDASVSVPKGTPQVAPKKIVARIGQVNAPR